MKIIAGRAKGRNIYTNPSMPQTRPILARIKKSLFDILFPRLPGSNFLDLYAGTGAVGLEAASRGSHRVCFVEKDRRLRQIIDRNVKSLGFDKECEIYQLDVLGNLSILPGPFDLIFMGPPYRDEQKNNLQLVNPTLKNIYHYQLLKPNGLVVAQHFKKEEVEPPADDWEMSRQKKYGDSRLSFFQRKIEA